MTDKDIIKALEVARYHLTASKHKDAIDNALDLINRQQEEIDRLRKEAEVFADIGKMYSEVKAEAVKEFAERLCKDRVSNDPVVIAVKVELKEMVGEGK